MITELRLTNFKAFRNEQRIPLSRLNLIYGQNSSGKSSIIDGLLFLYGITQRPGGVQLRSRTAIRICGQTVRLPTIYGSTHVGGRRRGFSVGLTTRTDGKPAQASIEFSSASCVTFSLDGEAVARILPQKDSDTMIRGVCNKSVLGAVEISRSARFFRRTCVEIAGELRQWVKTTHGKRWLGNFKGEPDSEKALDELSAGASQRLRRLIQQTRDSYHFDLLGLFPKYVGQNPPGDMAGAAEKVSERTANNILDVGHALSRLFVKRLWGRYVSILTNSLNSVGFEFLTPIYLGPHRGLIGTGTMEFSEPFHGSELEGGDFPSPGVFGGMVLSEKRVALANKWLGSRHRTDTQVELRLSRVESKEGDEQSFHLGYRLGIYDRRRKLETDFSGVGAGFSEFTPILLACVHGQIKGDDDEDDDYACFDPLVIIEQPEIHLHPALQAEVGDLLIEGALGTKAGQVVAESHSEYLLLRVLRRIRETAAGTLPKGALPITPNDVSLLYVDNLGPRSVVRRMPINERGELIFDWPAGFFEVGVREVVQ